MWPPGFKFNMALKGICHIHVPGGRNGIFDWTEPSPGISSLDCILVLALQLQDALTWIIILSFLGLDFTICEAITTDHFPFGSTWKDFYSPFKPRLNAEACLEAGYEDEDDARPSCKPLMGPVSQNLCILPSVTICMFRWSHYIVSFLFPMYKEGMADKIFQ